MPFTRDEFFGMFAAYNAAIWPLQVLAYLLGLAAVGLAFRRRRGAAPAILWILAAMWAVNGIGYHWAFFAEVNPAARIFGALFVLEAGLLAAAPWLAPDVRFAPRGDVRTVAGLVLVVFAMLVYPLWGRLAGHPYRAAPVFGVAPCPTTIFTLGLLMIARGRRVWWLGAIPLLWAALGGSAALLLGVPQDYGLLAALVVTLAIIGADWMRPPGRAW